MMFISDIAIAASLVFTVFIILLSSLAYSRTKLRKLLAPIIIAVILAVFQSLYLLSGIYELAIGIGIYDHPIFFLLALLAPAIALLSIVLSKGRS